MSGRISKSKKRKGASKAPPDSAPTSQIPKLKLHIPPLSIATDATVQNPHESPTQAVTLGPTTLPTQGQAIQNSQAAELYLPDPYPTPLEMIDQFREDEHATTDAEEVLYHCNIHFLPAKIILFYLPHLREYIAQFFVPNGAVIIELYTICYTSASKLSVLILLPRYAGLLRLFTQNYILFYSAHLRDSTEHVFVLNGAVFVELLYI
jgi:hypothetical protein